jgi:hypothetical protein
MRVATSRRRRRQTIVRWVSNLVLVSALGLAAFFGFRVALDRFFFRNGEYTVHRISFNLDGVLTREEALAATGLREGINIFPSTSRRSKKRFGRFLKSRTCGLSGSCPIRST